MQQDPPEFLTTLRDVAATAVSFLDALAHVKRERTTASSAASPPSTQAPPAPPATPAPTTPADASEVIPSGPPCPVPGEFLLSAMDGIDDDDETDLPLPRGVDLRRQLTERSVRASEREYQLFEQRRTLTERTTSIHQRLCAISDLVGATLDADRPRVLAVLDAVLGRLEAELRDGSGPFAADPVREMVG